MAQPADPQSVLDAIKETHAESGRSAVAQTAFRRELAASFTPTVHPSGRP